MRVLRVIIAVVLINIIHMCVVSAQDISIRITEIIQDQYIFGDIRGLTSKDYSNYKVIVYVKTDRWYIHPYAGQDEGLSWAAIQTNGTWRIQTVKRRFTADKVAVLLVKRNYREPNQVDNLEDIQPSAIMIQELRGTKDDGKL